MGIVRKGAKAAVETVGDNLVTKGTRSVDNLFTGLKLGKAGHTVAVGAGIYGMGKSVYNASSLSNEPQPSVGVATPPSMSYDGRQNNSMGADGELALALSRLS